MIRNRILAAVAASAIVAASALPANAAAMSDYLENKIIDWFFRGQTFAPPTTMYAALITGTASDTGCTSEVASGAYARVAVTSSLTNWAGTQGAGTNTTSSGTNGTTSNNNVITFPTPTAGWGTVTAVCVYDASTAGNMLWYSTLTVSKTINTNDVVDFPAGSLTFQVDN